MHHTHFMTWTRETLLPKVQEKMAIKGFNQSSLAREASIGNHTIKDWFSGKIHMPRADRVKAIVDALGIEEPSAQIPFWGEVPGGAPILIEEPQKAGQSRVVALAESGILDGKRVVEIPRPKPNSFAMMVRGQSMNLVAPEGHYLIVNPNIPPIDELDNKLVVASVNGECTFKRFGYHPLRLEPVSTDYEFRAQFFEPDEIRIVGVVELILKDLR